ncbi:hypothetical protein NQ317_012438 [Molorchus minor]|uniref:Uncharacterized protein n=1 Tax=Molorchus minor TaxID=1323400 RepID=A0ABQ9JYT1_9CUCU|nr:hypothetical protein NQ317_012438 [Molorchus minor]
MTKTSRDIDCGVNLTWLPSCKKNWQRDVIAVADTHKLDIVFDSHEIFATKTIDGALPFGSKFSDVYIPAIYKIYFQKVVSNVCHQRAILCLESVNNEQDSFDFMGKINGLLQAHLFQKVKVKSESRKLSKKLKLHLFLITPPKKYAHVAEWKVNLSLIQMVPRVLYSLNPKVGFSFYQGGSEETHQTPEVYYIRDWLFIFRMWLYLRCKKQSYLKQRLQNKVWNECIVCSLGTDAALGPSMLGVHSGGALGSVLSKDVPALKDRHRLDPYMCHDHRTGILFYSPVDSTGATRDGNVKLSRGLRTKVYFVFLLFEVKTSYWENDISKKNISISKTFLSNRALIETSKIVKKYAESYLWHKDEFKLVPRTSIYNYLNHIDGEKVVNSLVTAKMIISNAKKLSPKERRCVAK